MSDVTESEIKRWAADVSDWVWGTVQGAWNDKQTLSQIIVDAVIGMIPLVGDVTAVRDLIAVATHLAEDPKRRENVSEWVLLVVLLFALIPVFGGVIKGVGRLLLKIGRSAADNAVVIRNIIKFLNRVGHGNAVKFINELDLFKYQDDLIRKFNEFCDKLDEAFKAIRRRFKAVLSREMLATIDLWIERFAELKRLGARMIPRAMKDLDERLRLVRQALYEGDWHVARSGSNATTREAEARLVEGLPPVRPKRTGYPQNCHADYHHKDGWPDISRPKTDKATGATTYPAIEAFSGPIKAVTLKGPKRIYRIIKPGKNGRASPWWVEDMPPNALEWREGAAVLDKFNLNGFYIVYEIPAGSELKAWKGRAAEQWDAARGQHLPGGAYQLFIDTSKIKDDLEKLPALSTGWGKTTKLYGYDERSRATLSTRVENLGKNEFKRKLPSTTGPTAAGTRGVAAEERAEETSE